MQRKTTSRDEKAVVQTENLMIFDMLNFCHMDLYLNFIFGLIYFKASLLKGQNKNFTYINRS
jgi:hypothetical protein